MEQIWNYIILVFLFKNDKQIKSQEVSLFSEEGAGGGGSTKYL